MDLKLAVLSRGPRLYSTRRLVQEAHARGIEVEVTDPMKFSLFVVKIPEIITPSKSYLQLQDIFFQIKVIWT